jgi:hypothetical membrane protein
MRELLKVFFTLIEAWYAMPGYVHLGVLAAPFLLALLHRRARQSRLVRTGFVLLLISILPLLLVGTFSMEANPNPVGLGLLFVFVSPIAYLLILSGAIVAVFTSRDN